MWNRRKTDPLLEAIRLGDLEEVKRIAASGMNLSESYPKSSGAKLTPLCQAAVSNQMEIAEWLLQNGARLESVLDLGFVLLKYASEAKKVGFVRSLLAQGIGIETGTASAMVEGAFSGSLEIFELLLEYGGDVRDLEGTHEFMLQRVKGEILRIAIARGAKFPQSVVELAMSYTALGDTGVPSDGYRR